MAMEIKYSNVSADYQLGPIRTKNVLDDVNLLVKPSSFIAIVGQTGAGKSSLLKVMNGLIRPKQGEVKIGEYSVSSNNDPISLKEVRKRVGMVFQFPESQLFAETVEKDICFGPLNFGVALSEAKEMAKTAIYQVGLDASFLPKSPFSLSGGQKRRVAIAGILAMKPDILILDEPGAGLDPIGKQEILSLIASWNKNNKLTTMMVTHEMDDVAQFADEVIVMEKGKVVFHDDVRSFFADLNQIQSWNLDIPEARRFQLLIEEKTGVSLPKICLTVEELADCLIEVGLV
jgi:energy-coupling factor transport system ATP-binding protein